MRAISLLTAFLSIAATTARAAPDFAHEIVPILRENCAQCHTGERVRGGLSMNTRADLVRGGKDGLVIVPGNSALSDLIRRVSSADEHRQMPPPGANRRRLSGEQVRKLAEWIDGGAEWQDGFAFRKAAYDPPLKPRRPVLPPAMDGRINPIDRIVDAYVANRHAPRPLAIHDGAFLRRINLDLIGLLPRPSRMEAFLTDSRADKRAIVVRELLGDDLDYAEHWLSFWNDLLRNDYAGTGYIDNGRKQISKWLYRSLVRNKPYDQFTRELIAPSPESEGFAKGIEWRGTVSVAQSVPVQFAQSVGQTFLGINLKCASCHDSFIDRWKLDDSYGLAAVYADHPLQLYRCDKPTGRMAKPAWLFPELGQIDPEKPAPERLKQLGTLITHPENGRFTRTIVNRLWQRLMGRGIVHPVDAMQTQPWSADLLDYLAVDLEDNHYDLKKTLELICTSQAYQSRAETVSIGAESTRYVYAGPRAKRLTAEQFTDAVWQITGTAPNHYDAPIIRGEIDAAGEAVLRTRWMRMLRRYVSQPMARASLMQSDMLMRTLGRPNREQIVSMRPEELNTLEAMDLINGRILNDRLERGAKNLLSRRWESGDAMIRWVYEFALSRPPSADELALTRAALGENPTVQSTQDLLWAVLMLPEFQLVR